VGEKQRNARSLLSGALLHGYRRVHAMIAELLGRVATGKLRVEVDKAFPLAEAATAHAYIESRQAFGRVELTR
jgi:NADPH:quinone reductase